MINVDTNGKDQHDTAFEHHERLTAALRRVIEANALLEIPDFGLDPEIEQIEALAHRLESWAVTTDQSIRPGPGAGDLILDDPGRAMSINPIVGRCSPIAPPVEMSLRNNEVRGSTRLGHAYVGPPGRVHGGWVCGLLDQVLGFACVAAGHPSFTASITVQLRKATPLDTELELVGRVTDVTGRRVTTWGAIYADGELTAEADGLFIKIPSDFGSGPKRRADPKE